MMKSGVQVFLTAFLLAGLLSACSQQKLTEATSPSSGLSGSEDGPNQQPQQAVSSSPDTQAAAGDAAAASGMNSSAGHSAGASTGSSASSSTGPSEGPTSGLSADPSADSTASSPAAPADTAAAAFEEGVFTDAHTLKDPLVKPDIQEQLNLLMKVVADGDEAAFAKLFPDKDTAAYYDYEFADAPRYRFEQVGDGVIEEDSEGRISIPVSGKVLRNGEIHAFSWYVYFKKFDPDGWKLIAMD